MPSSFSRLLRKGMREIRVVMRFLLVLILSVSMQTFPLAEIPPASGTRFQRANLLFAAELLALYPKEDIFILARDSEYLYYLMHSLLDGREEQDRVHYLVANRANKSDPQFARYLRENGLGSGPRGSVLVDTGYSGSIVKSIRESLGPEAGAGIQAHFVTSKNPGIPQSRVFLDVFAPSGWVPKPLVDKYHHYNLYYRVESALPHAHRRSRGFALEGGQATPLLHPSLPEEQVRAEQLVRETRAFGAQPATRREFDRLTNDMRALTDYAFGHTTKGPPVGALSDLGEEISGSFLRDLTELARVRGEDANVSDRIEQLAQVLPRLREENLSSSSCASLYARMLRLLPLP